jgi:hypothetical protein
MWGFMTSDKLVTVAIPILNRPERIKTVYNYFSERTGRLENVLFLPDRDDFESISILNELGYNYLISKPSEKFGVQTYASKINYAFLNSNLEFFMYAADDVIPQPGWFTILLNEFKKNPNVGVVVPNDNLTLAVQEGRGAPHAVIRREYVNKFNGASFPGSGIVMHEGYRHAFCDTELMEVAKKRKAFLYVPESVVVHDRPGLSEKNVDEVYKLGLQSWNEDMMEFENRMKQNKNNISIFVATPMHAGTCTDGFAKSCLALQREADKKDIEIEFVFLSGDSMITSARNTLVHAFLKTNFTHFLFIDSDITFEGHQVLDMVLRDIDVIGGVYPKKHISWDNIYHAVRSGVKKEHLPLIASNYVVNPISGGPIELGGRELIDVRHLGTGMLCIKREVFELLKSKVPTYVMGDALDKNYNSGGIEDRDLVYEFFSTEIDEVLIAEDYYFCDLWRKNGGKIFLAPWVRLKHTGNYTFG